MFLVPNSIEWAWALKNNENRASQKADLGIFNIGLLTQKRPSDENQLLRVKMAEAFHGTKLTSGLNDLLRELACEEGPESGIQLARKHQL